MAASPPSPFTPLGPGLADQDGAARDISQGARAFSVREDAAPCTHAQFAANLRAMAQELEDGTRACPACLVDWPVMCVTCREATVRCDGFRRRATWHESQPADEPAFVAPLRRAGAGR